MRSKICLKIIILLLNCLLSGFLWSQNPKIDSLKKVVLTQKDTTEVKTIYLIAKEFAATSIDSAKKYNEISLGKAIKIGYSKGHARALMLKAGIFRVKGEIDSAVFVYNSIIKIADKNGLIAESGEAHMFIGFILQNQSEFDQSVVNLIIAEKKFEKINNTALLARNSWMLGNTYLKLKSYDESEASFKKGQKYFGVLGDSLGYFDCVLNTSIIYSAKNQFKEAYSLILQSERHYRRVNHLGALSAALINKGDVLSRMGNYPASETALLEALQIKKSLGAPLGIATCLMNLAELYEAKKDFKKAESTYFEAIELARKDNSQSVILMSYEGLYNAYKNQNNLKLALQYHEKYMSLNDSIYNSDKSKIIEEMKTKFETEKKDKQILQKNSEIEKNVLEIKQKSFQRNAFLVGLFLVLILVVIALVAYRQKKRANKILFQQNKEITLQKHLIQEQKHRVEEHQKEIVDSINYAKRIQYALLANEVMLKSNLNKHFILFNPKDIVSGDFYWAAEHNNKFYIAICDSTGHGVPGAFMSLLNIGFLNEAVKEKGIEKPNEILNYVRKRLIESISNEQQKDGMDAILFCFDNNSTNSLEKKITYAAANNEPILVRGNEIMELPKDKMPVGKGEKTDSFTLQTIDAQRGDTFYLYTDGYADQFGGPKGKKFKYKQLNDLLLSICRKDSEEQKQCLSQMFVQWKGDLEQVDDVLIIGIEI